MELTLQSQIGAALLSRRAFLPETHWGIAGFFFYANWGNAEKKTEIHIQNTQQRICIWRDARLCVCVWLRVFVCVCGCGLRVCVWVGGITSVNISQDPGWEKLET